MSDLWHSLAKLPLRYYLPSLCVTLCSVATASVFALAGLWWLTPISVLLVAASWFIAMLGAYYHGWNDAHAQLRRGRADVAEQRRKAWLN